MCTAHRPMTLTWMRTNENLCTNVKMSYINDLYPNSHQRHLTLCIIETFRSSSFMLYILFYVQFFFCDFYQDFKPKQFAFTTIDFQPWNSCWLSREKNSPSFRIKVPNILSLCPQFLFLFPALHCKRQTKGDVPFFRTRVNNFEAAWDALEELKSRKR